MDIEMLLKSDGSSPLALYKLQNDADFRKRVIAFMEEAAAPKYPASAPREHPVRQTARLYDGVVGHCRDLNHDHDVP
jgi:hypothetical protein